MSAIKSIGARLHRDKRGVPMVEYSILIGLITAAAVRLIAAQSPQDRCGLDDIRHGS